MTRLTLFAAGVALCLSHCSGPARASTTELALDVACPGHRDLAPLVDAAARRQMQHPVLLVALMRKESHCRADAVSRKGAVCEMQLLGVARNGHTRAELQGDSRLCIETGARWLGRMQVWAGSRVGGLGAYNTGKRGRGMRFARHVLAVEARIWREMRRAQEPSS